MTSQISAPQVWKFAATACCFSTLLHSVVFEHYWLAPKEKFQKIRKHIFGIHEAHMSVPALDGVPQLWPSLPYLKEALQTKYHPHYLLSNSGARG